jgi:hypothetical protein
MITVDWKYLSLPREERRSHLDLSENCLERGGNSTVHKGVLAQFLNTDLPGTLQEGRVCLCHACHNGKCSNPRHLYWGTDADNILDQKENGTHSNPYKRTIDKYGEEEALKIIKRNGRKAIKVFNENPDKRKTQPSMNHRGFNESEINERLQVISKIDLTVFGWVEKVAKALGVTHTQARRFIKKYYHGEVYTRKSPSGGIFT